MEQYNKLVFSDPLDYETVKEGFLEINYDKPFILDLKMVERITSSGLGFLLLLRENSPFKDPKIKIINTNDYVLKVLETVNFQRLFDIN